ncbi:MAG: methyltransferase domain-containing protein [Candidatus Krumholzibacteriia bacterium]
MDLPFTGEYLVPGRSPRHLEEDHLARYRFALDHVRGRRVLDIACGTGYGAHLLATGDAVEVVGVDVDEQVVAYARDRYRKPNLRFATGDITRWRDAEPFAVITCFETVEHVPDHRAALANLHALLAAGGTLLISSPNRPVTSPAARTPHDPPANPHHVREFTPGELRRELAAAGFGVDDVTWGQRPQIRFGVTILRKAYKTVFRPWERADPAVKPVGRLVPEYFVLLARRPG